MPSDTYTLIVSDVGFATPIDGSVTTAKIVDANVTLAKLQNIATDNLIGRSTAGTGVPELIPCTSFARTLLDDSNAATAQATLGLGNLATQNSSSVTVTGGSISGVSLSGSISSTATITGGTISTAAISGCTITSGSIATNTLTGTVAVANGGTNLASYTVGDMLYASGATTLSKLAAGASDTALLSGTAPSWGKVPLTTHVSGVLPIANGGTGLPLSGYAQLYMIDGSTSQTITTAGTYEKLAGDATTIALSHNFSDGTGTPIPVASNRLVYTGSVTRYFFVDVHADISADSTDSTVAIRIALNGSPIAFTECRGCASGSGALNSINDHLTKNSTSYIIQMATNHYLEVYVTTYESASEVITPRRLRMVVTPVF